MGNSSPVIAVDTVWVGVHEVDRILVGWTGSTADEPTDLTSNPDMSGFWIVAFCPRHGCENFGVRHEARRD